MTPSQPGECVRSQASQLTASVCTKKLSQEVTEAAVYKRKLRLANRRLLDAVVMRRNCQ